MAELLPTHMSCVKKMLDRCIGPFRITAVTGSLKYTLYNHTAQRDDIYRGESLSLWCPWQPEGTPSVPARRYLSKKQRMTINKQKTKFVPKEMEIGDLVVFPRTMEDGSQGFGVAKVRQRHGESAYDCQWYSNPTEKLLGTYLPCWMLPNGQWYCAKTARNTRHEPMMTTGTYPWAITRELIADCGFQLTAGNKLPDSVLDHMMDHRKFHWKHT